MKPVEKEDQPPPLKESHGQYSIVQNQLNKGGICRAAQAAPPRDGVRAWLFLLLACLSQCVLYGTCISGGMLNAYLLDAFSASRSFTSVPFAVALAILVMGGIVASPVVNRWGCRCGIILGGLLAATGLIISSFATGIGFLIPSFGVITGLGLAFGYLTMNVAAGQLFHRHRTLAFALISTGLAVGIVIYPPLIHLLTEHFSWRGCLLIMGALCLHLVIPAFLLPRSTKSTARISTKEAEKSDVIKHEMSILLSTDKTHPEEPNKPKPTLFHWDIFKSKIYIVDLCSVFWRGWGKSTFYIHIVAIAVQEVMPIDEAANVLLLNGCVHVVFRPLAGVLANYFGRKKNFIWAVTSTLLCVVTFLGPMATYSRIYFYLFIGVVSLLDAFYDSLYSSVFFDAVGEKSLSSALGVAGVVYGSAQVIGPPIAGLLYDTYKTYSGTFYSAAVSYLLAGAFALVAGIMALKSHVSENRKTST